MKKQSLIAFLAGVLILTFIFSFVWAYQGQPQPSVRQKIALDCQWEETKVDNEIGWKCTGKDCETCAKNVESKAKQLGSKLRAKLVECCRCYRGADGVIICKGPCCRDICR